MLNSLKENQYRSRLWKDSRNAAAHCKSVFQVQGLERQGGKTAMHIYVRLPPLPPPNSSRINAEEGIAEQQVKTLRYFMIGELNTRNKFWTKPQYLKKK